MEAGFKPMNDRINERVALCVWEIMHKKTWSYPNQFILCGYQSTWPGSWI